MELSGGGLVFCDFCFRHYTVPAGWGPDDMSRPQFSKYASYF